MREISAPSSIMMDTMGSPRGNQIILRLARALAAAWLLAAPPAVVAQDAQPEPQTRAALIEQQQAAKVLRPYQPGKAEQWLDWAESTLTTGSGPHPFFDSAYSGRGFTLGAGYLKYISPNNTVDVRGSITFSGYKRIESEFIAPELFGHPLRLSVLGGWRDATEVGFYGIGTNTSQENRVNYSFEQPYASTQLTIRPGRRHWFLAGGVDASFLAAQARSDRLVLVFLSLAIASWTVPALPSAFAAFAWGLGRTL